jgi:small-conductance mechanosensitive channel
MILGWSLQAPVTGIAAWLMIVLVKPFRIGDRVIIGGIVGDVTDITLTHVILNQVGGTIGGEEKSGRGVLIPNATMFGQIIYNYSFETKYITDEVPVMVTFDSDFALAEKMCIDAANKVVAGIIRETGSVPFVRREFTDWGIRIRVRYQCAGVDRQRVSSDIVKLILDDFNQTDKVTFCYPHTEIVYHPESGQKRIQQDQSIKEESRR